MELIKGDIIKQIKQNSNPMFNNTTANSVLTYKVTRVNKKTYSLKCIEGYMKNTEYKLQKSFKEESTDIYGTITKWILV